MSFSVLPNISEKGRRQRRMLGIVAGVLAVLMLLAVVWLNAPVAVRLLVFVPAFVSALGWLQSRRGTCVALAFSGGRAADCEIAASVAEASRASRGVAWTIVRDALLVGLLAAILAVALGAES